MYSSIPSSSSGSLLHLAKLFPDFYTVKTTYVDAEYAKFWGWFFLSYKHNRRSPPRFQFRYPPPPKDHQRADSMHWLFPTIFIFRPGIIAEFSSIVSLNVGLNPEVKGGGLIHHTIYHRLNFMDEKEGDLPSSEGRRWGRRRWGEEEARGEGGGERGWTLNQIS